MAAIVDKTWRLAIWAACERACVYCDVPMPDEWCIDHVRPNGRHDPGNLVAACKSCNSTAHSNEYRTFWEKRADVRERRGLEPDDIYPSSLHRRVSHLYERLLATPRRRRAA